MPRALIIGGSVGGLFTASLLRNIGWDVAVFEKSTGDISGRGAGIGLSGELFDVMRRAGADVNEAIGVPCPHVLWLDRHGAVRSRIERSWTAGIWASIYRALRAAVPDTVVFPGRALERVTEEDDRVLAHFADCQSEAGDLLVACDGVQSTVRQQFLPEIERRYAGYVAWRFLTEERLLPDEGRALLSDAHVHVFPPGEMSLSMPNPGRSEDVRPGKRGYYLIWYRPADPDQLREMMTDASGRDHGMAIPPPLIRNEVIAAMRRDAPSLLPPVLADVVAQTEQPLLQAITDLDVPRMVFGRSVLLGDAAFVARPHVAAGVTKAALDADALAKALTASPTDLSAALADYEATQLSFGQAMVDYSRKLGAASLAPDDVRDPERVMREYGAPHLIHNTVSGTIS